MRGRVEVSMGDGGCEGIPGECGGGGGEGDLNIYTATFSKTQRRKQNHGKKKKRHTVSVSHFNGKNTNEK